MVNFIVGVVVGYYIATHKEELEAWWTSNAA